MLENMELITKYEKLGIELNNVSIELILRRNKDELSDVEWNHILDIASRRGSELVDYAKINRQDMQRGLEKVADILSDKNR